VFIRVGFIPNLQITDQTQTSGVSPSQAHNSFPHCLYDYSDRAITLLHCNKWSHVVTFTSLITHFVIHQKIEIFLIWEIELSVQF